MNQNGPVALLAARCKRCGQIVAHYATNKKGNTQWFRFARVQSRGGATAEYPACICDPPPPLPQGEQLDKFLARARGKPPSASRFRAPFQIRV